MEESDRGGPFGYVFAVADQVFCCWEHDHAARTLEFLDGLNCDYFTDVAVMFADRIASTAELAASIALRATYQQGIESLMSLLGAVAQAPDAVPAWIAKASTQGLTDVAGRLGSGEALLTQQGLRGLTFEGLSEHIHRHVWVEESGADATPARFGRFWRRLASEMLDDVARAEYNAIKHGNRVSAGGFHLSIGPETEPGVPAAPEVMRSLGGSRFGSSFFVSEQVGSTKWHIRTRRTSVNWSAELLVQRLVLISMSIANVVAALRCDLGADPTTQQFHRPIPAAAFDDVWAGGPGVRHSSMDRVIRIGIDDEISREELRAILEARHGDAG
jgi:hypothetical protein